MEQSRSRVDRAEWKGIRTMLYAVTIDPLNAIFFVSERPDGDQWELLEGVSLDAPPVYGIGRPGREQKAIAAIKRGT
jgi:hypothetical protein